MLFTSEEKAGIYYNARVLIVVEDVREANINTSALSKSLEVPTGFFLFTSFHSFVCSSFVYKQENAGEEYFPKLKSSLIVT